MSGFQLVWQNPYIRVFVYLGMMVLTFFFLKAISSVLIVAVCAYLIAYLLNPLLDYFEKRKVPRAVGFGVVVVFLLILAGVGYALISTIIDQFAQLIKIFPTAVKSITDWLKSIAEWLNTISKAPFALQYSEQISNLLQTASERLTSSANSALSGAISQSSNVVGGLVNVANWIFQLFLILVLSLYMMIDYHRINTTLCSAFPLSWQPKVLEFSGQVSIAVGSYIRGQLLIALIMGLLIGLLLTLVGVPSGLALGFLAGVFNVVPYLGAIIAIVPTVLLALSVSWLKVVLALVIFFVASQIEGQFLSPNILGRSTDLHPATVVISILIGVALLGVVGAILAVPTAALIKLLMKNYYYTSHFYQKDEKIS